MQPVRRYFRSCVAVPFACGLCTLFCLARVLFLPEGNQRSPICAGISSKQCFAGDKRRFKHDKRPEIIVYPFIKVFVVAIAKSSERGFAEAVEVCLKRNPTTASVARPRISA